MLAVSPGPLHVDSVALAYNKVVMYYSTSLSFSLKKKPDLKWKLKNNVSSVSFCPKGKRILITVSAAERFIVIGIDEKTYVELSEPLSGSGLVNSIWPFDNWIVTFADFGLHLSLWNAPSLLKIAQPDRILKPKCSIYNRDTFVLDFYSSAPTNFDYIAVAHGESFVSIFCSELNENDWKILAKWESPFIEGIFWVDDLQVLTWSDMVYGGELLLRNAIDGSTLKAFGKQITSLCLSTNKFLAYVKSEGMNSFLNLIRFYPSEKNFPLKSTFSDIIKMTWNLDSSRLAVIAQVTSLQTKIKMSQEEHYSIVFCYFEAQYCEENIIRFPLDFHQFVDFSWNPVSFNCCIVLAKHVVYLWRGKHENEDEKFIIVFQEKKSLKNAFWNSIGSLLFLTFEKEQEIPITLSLGHLIL